MRARIIAMLTLLSLAACAADSPPPPVSAGATGNAGTATAAPVRASNGTTISSGGQFNPKTGTFYSGPR